MALDYSSVKESHVILEKLIGLLGDDDDTLPAAVLERLGSVEFRAERDLPYFPIPFKETETTAALKALEAAAAAALADLKCGEDVKRPIVIDLEKTTAFLFQTYLATVGGYGKLDDKPKNLLKDTDLKQAQSDPYRRMSANMYETKTPGEYYHIHGSLEASTTLKMIGLNSHEPELAAGSQEKIAKFIGDRVKEYTVYDLEKLNKDNGQAGVPVLKHNEFRRKDHGKVAWQLTPWSVTQLEEEITTPPTPLPDPGSKRPLAGIKVLELCRIIAGPTITRILAEYGATVLKITSPNLSDVPFFQVDVNMGKHTAELDLKTEDGRKRFQELAQDADIVVDGYRPGAIEKLGFGLEYFTALASKRKKGVVYVNENCFGYAGTWANRGGWQQIADCASGLAWSQGRFMGLQEPVVPPFPISDYGTGCMGAIAALTGLIHRTKVGGSWHGKVSLLQYDLLLYKAGLYPPEVQDDLRKGVTDNAEYGKLRHFHSVDKISGTVLEIMREKYPNLFTRQDLTERWYSEKYKGDVMVVSPVASIGGVEVGFQRASRPNGSDDASWDFGADGDCRKI
ncbi:putative L-carnitine dehydratase [Xylariales sp. PMI_506]|nr:putative L-carnitine dehydratase [Xylariales sp. PMI_506]